MAVAQAAETSLNRQIPSEVNEMATAIPTQTESNDITSRLARLRRLIRVYVALHGLASCVIGLAIGFWLTLAIDWIFEPSVPVRAVILAVVCLGLLYIVLERILRRLMVPLTDRNMAMLLERRYRQLGERLLTVVELEPRKAKLGGYDPTMLQQTRDETLELLQDAEVSPVMNYRPLLRSAIGAVLLIGSIIGLSVWDTATAQTWFNRDVLLGDARWPRATRILVEGFEDQRTVKVARGSALTIRAKADTAMVLPDALQIRYETAEGSTGKPNMTMLKRAVPGRDDFQDFEYEFKNIQSNIEFDVVAIHGGIFGKNDRVRDLLIRTVDSPDLIEVALQCKFPKYLDRPDEKFQVGLVKPLPEGTDVTMIGTVNKDLIKAEYQILSGDPDAVFEGIDIDANNLRIVRLPLGPLRADTRVDIRLLDHDHVTNHQPIRTSVRIVADEPPQVDVNLVGIGKAITPMAFLPVQGTIRDDHDVTATWFEYQVNSGEKGRRRFELDINAINGKGGHEFETQFEVEDVVVQPGQVLTFWVKAADNFGLADKPQISTSQRYSLQVVTEGQLRGILETRERILRRRFESIIEELGRTQDSLTRLVRSASSADDDEPEEAPALESSSSRRILRVEQALQASDRMRNETSEIATEIGRILLELENNNVSFLDELRRRLGDGIASPLVNIADEQFPLLDDRLTQLRRVLEKEVDRQAAGLAARRQIDLMLLQMNEVLKNMLELQKFNELLADLRKIIDSQKQVSIVTEEQRELLKKRLKDELKKGLLD